MRLINDWPDPISAIANSEKVPTVISYDEDGEPENFGYSVPATGQGLRWFKLLLDPKHSYARTREARAAQRALQNMNITAENAAADYLRMIWAYTKADITRVKGDGWEPVYALKIVLTVPAIWTPAARDRTKRVAVMAGIPGNIVLVTEPEAAALAVLKDKNEEDANLKVGSAERCANFGLTNLSGRRCFCRVRCRRRYCSTYDAYLKIENKLTEREGPDKLQSIGSGSSPD